MKFHKLIHDLPSEEYHGTKNIFSSSQFKDILEDEEIFYRKYITRELPREESDAFGTGTVFHTGVLEPHKLKDECAVFPGRVRKGSLWDSFLATHKGKCIVTAQQFATANQLIDLVKQSEVAMDYINLGVAEVSYAAALYVHEGVIFAPARKVRLSGNGWRPCSAELIEKAMRLGSRLNVTVRAVSLGPDFVLDLKSTTGNAKSQNEMEYKIRYYNYDLSAALYLDVFSLALNKQLDKFIWTFASKDKLNTKSYLASSDNIQVGRAKWSCGLIKIADCISHDWQFPDELGILEPRPEEIHWLRKIKL